MRPVRRPEPRTWSRSWSVMSTNSVGPEVLKRRRFAIIGCAGRPRRAVRGQDGPRPGKPRPQRALRWRGRKRPGESARHDRRGAATRARGKDHPSAAAPRAPPARPGPEAAAPPRLERRPEPAAAGRRRRMRRRCRGRTCKSPRARPPRGPPGVPAPCRSAALAPSFDRLDEAGGQLAKGREGTKAGLVVPGHHVIEAEAKHRVENQRDEHLARDGEPDAAVRLEAVELLQDDLAVPREQLGQVGAKALGARRLDQEIESGELNVAKL